MDRRRFLKVLGFGAAGATLATFGVVSSEYMDIFGFDEKTQAGRTKNSIAAVVTGLIGQKLYENSNIDVYIEKYLWPDAKITGYTSPKSIETYVDLALTSVHFSAKENQNGLLEGEVDKSEFDWKIKQTGPDSYDIARFGLKFDTRLELKVQDGKISGTYVRPEPHFNWGINGTYDKNGHIKCEIDGHMNLGITLNGKITSKSHFVRLR